MNIICRSWAQKSRSNSNCWELLILDTFFWLSDCLLLLLFSTFSTLSYFYTLINPC